MTTTPMYTAFSFQPGTLAVTGSLCSFVFKGKQYQMEAPLAGKVVSFDGNVVEMKLPKGYAYIVNGVEMVAKSGETVKIPKREMIQHKYTRNTEKVEAYLPGANVVEGSLNGNVWLYMNRFSYSQTARSLHVTYGGSCTHIFQCETEEPLLAIFEDLVKKDLVDVNQLPIYKSDKVNLIAFMS
jgi:hypothetical protein